MIAPDTIQAFNNRHRLNLNNIKTMTPSQKDAVITWGSEAENLLTNKSLVQFIHEAKFNIADVLSDIQTHDADSNNQRIALANQLAGIDSVISLLQQAVYYKARVLEARPREDKV